MTLESRRVLRMVLPSLLLASALLPLSACSSAQPAAEPIETDDSGSQAEEPTGTEDPADAPATEIAWADIELTDVETGETFTISEFAGGPVLIQAFAVW